MSCRAEIGVLFSKYTSFLRNFKTQLFKITTNCRKITHFPAFSLLVTALYNKYTFLKIRNLFMKNYQSSTKKAMYLFKDTIFELNLGVDCSLS